MVAGAVANANREVALSPEQDLSSNCPSALTSVEPVLGMAD
jgi:hypothetical protein